MSAMELELISTFFLSKDFMAVFFYHKFRRVQKVTADAFI
jgi:hypothetical protein